MRMPAGRFSAHKGASVLSFHGASCSGLKGSSGFHPLDILHLCD